MAVAAAAVAIFTGSNIRLPADNYDLDSEWGRSGARHRMNVSVNLRLPWDINANTIFNWNSGSPYTHQTGRDDNLDTTRNDRPPGVPKNSLTGPGFFETGFDLSKAIQLRSDQVELTGPNGAPGQGPVGTGGYYGQRTGLRMTIRAQVTNLLNNVNYQSFSGVETSRFFLLPTRARNPAADDAFCPVRFLTRISHELVCRGGDRLFQVWPRLAISFGRQFQHLERARRDHRHIQAQNRSLGRHKKYALRRHDGHQRRKRFGEINHARHADNGGNE